MSQVHVYVQPFDPDGNAYSGTWTEVTDDVEISSLGKIKQYLDNTEYDVGVFRNSNLSVTFRNDHGKYSDAGEALSIFQYRRNGSQLKVTWEPGDVLLQPIFMRLGWTSMISAEVELFRGLIKDEASKESFKDQKITFSVQGFESIFNTVEVPVASLSIGNLISVVIYTCLNQADITDLLTVDQANIVCGTDLAVDAVDVFTNKTVLEMLKELLLASNSVLYIDDDLNVIVSDRDESAALAYSFYGPDSTSGIENILAIEDYRSGINRVINYWTWTDTTLIKTDAASVSMNGIYKKDIDCDAITNTTKRNTILENLAAEFCDKKIEMELLIPLTPTTAVIGLLDKINIDHPIMTLSPDGLPIAIYEIGQYDVHYYANEVANILISPSTYFKVIAKETDIKNDVITLTIREV